MSQTPTSAADGEQLKDAVRRGARTAVAAQIVSQLISLAVLACLFRLIAPDDFGLVAMILPLLLLLRSLATMGLNVATIQRREISSAELSSVFWLNLSLGAVATALTAALAPVLVRFYGGRQELGLLTLALAGTTLVAAAGAQHQALLERGMRWVPLSVSRLSAQAAAGLAAVGAAFAGWGVWALVLQQYVELSVLAAAFWRLQRWRPLRPARGAAVTNLLALGGFFSAANLMSYLTANVDKVLIGVALGPRVLGWYSQAFNLMMKPGYMLTTPLAGIMLPALSRAVSQPATYRELLSAQSRLIAIVLFPAAAGLYVVAPEVMLVMGGPRWSAAGAILSALALALIAQGHVNMAATVFASAGRTGRLFAGAGVLAVIMCVIFAMAIWLGTTWGLAPEGVAQTVAWSYSLGLIGLTAGYMVYCMRTVGVPAWTWAQPILRPALAAVVMGIVVWTVRQITINLRWPPLPALIVLVAVGATVYAAVARRELGWLYGQLRQVGQKQ